MGQRSQNAEFRSNFSGLHVRERDSDGKLQLPVLIIQTHVSRGKCLLALPAAESLWVTWVTWVTYRCPQGGLGCSLLWWSQPGDGHIHSRVMEGTGVLCLEFVCSSEKQRNLRFKTHQGAQEWKIMETAFPVWEMPVFSPQHQSLALFLFQWRSGCCWLQDQPSGKRGACVSMEVTSQSLLSWIPVQ